MCIRDRPAADNDSLRSAPDPPRSARAPQKPLLPRRTSPSRLLQRRPTQGTDAAETTGPTAPAPASPGSPMPPKVKPSWDRISTRTRRRTATAASAAPPAVDYGFGPVGAPRPVARRANTPPRVPRPRPGPPTAATLLLPPRRSRRCQSRPTATAQSLWELLSYGLRPLKATHRLHLPSWMPLATMLNCSSLIPSRVIHMQIGSENSRLSRRATPKCVTSPSTGRRPC